MGYHVEGKYYKTMTEVAKAYGLSLSSLSRRMSRNRMTAEQAVLEFKSKRLMGSECNLNGKHYISGTEVEKEYNLPGNSFNRVLSKTGWQPEVVLAAIQRNTTHSKLYAYDGQIYFSKEEMCAAHGTTANTVKVCEHYYGIDFIDAFEIRIGRKKPPGKEEDLMPKTYRFKVEVEPSYIEITAKNEQEAQEFAQDHLDSMSIEDLSVMVRDAGLDLTDVEEVDYGPDTSLER